MTEAQMDRQAAREEKRTARRKVRYDKANPRRQATMTKQDERRATRFAKRDARNAERDARKAERGTVAGMKEKRTDTRYTDDDRAFFLQNAKQRNMTLKAYYAKYVK